MTSPAAACTQLMANCNSGATGRGARGGCLSPESGSRAGPLWGIRRRCGYCGSVDCSLTGGLAVLGDRAHVGSDEPHVVWVGLDEGLSLRLDVLLEEVRRVEAAALGLRLRPRRTRRRAF